MPLYTRKSIPPQESEAVSDKSFTEKRRFFLSRIIWWFFRLDKHTDRVVADVELLNGDIDTVELDEIVRY